MNIKTLSVFIICILILIIYTPQTISDKIYGKVCGDTIINYLDYSNNNIRYVFNHKNYDGELIAHYIKNNLSKYTLKENIPKCKLKKFKKYQYLNSKRIENYSRLTSTMSYLLYDMMHYQKRSLKIGILVSLRHKLKDKNKKGNFIKMATYTVNPSDTLLDICKIHNDKIKYIKNKNHLRYNTCFSDLIKGYQCDYIFNSWRSLTDIKTVENKNLIRQYNEEIKKIDMKRLIYMPSWNFIRLDYIDGNYIIGELVNLDDFQKNVFSKDM